MNDEIQIIGQPGFANQTTVHPLGLLMVAILGLCVIFLPRRWSALPFLIMACFVSSAQRVVIVGADFDFLRIMVLFGIIRLILNKEYAKFIWKPLDTAIVFWSMSSTFIFVVHEGTFAAIVNRLGFLFDAFGMYFIFRLLIQNYQDVARIIYGCIVISVPVALFFVLENQTGRNLFSIFGGVSSITVVREGRLRCQGAYSHPILAGCFWASLIPLIATLWWRSGKDRAWAITGLMTSSIIVICSASSTPLMGVLSAIIGGLFFYFRHRMRHVRWVVLLTLITLHIVMNAPVWHLISRVSAVGGSTSWHRYNVINQAINHFGDWWLMGCSGALVEGWGIYKGDITNQYVLEGVRGGIVTLIFFTIVIVVAFVEIGKLWRFNNFNLYWRALSWALGVSLFVHCMNFVGVAYFGQIWILWYLLLAIIGSLSEKTGITQIPLKYSSLCVSKSIKPQNYCFLRNYNHVS
jgi:hypothetical protein